MNCVIYKAIPTFLSSSSQKVTGILGFVWRRKKRRVFFLMFFL